MFFAFVISGAWASKADCNNPVNPPKPAKQVNKEDPNVQNDYDKIVKEDPKAIYLSLINGSTPKPNKCGLNPKNPPAEWTGWGGDHLRWITLLSVKEEEHAMK